MPAHCRISQLLTGGLLTAALVGYVANSVAADSPAHDAPLQAHAKLHPTLMELATQTPDPVKAWVFFTDKGVSSAAQLEEALQQVKQSYNPRAVARRALRGANHLRGGALFDQRDLPVVADYAEAVAHSGARVHISSRWLNAVSVRATSEQLSAIAALPFVRALQPVARARRIDPVEVAEPEPGATSGARETFGGLDHGLSAEQLSQINVLALHQAGYTGEGVIIGVLDTGFRQDHNALNNPDNPLDVVAEYDFLNDDDNTDIEPGDPSQQHFHGTLILGTMAAYAPGELLGGAFDASYILCKTEDTTDEYEAEEDYYVAGLEFIEANGGDVVNSSLGYIQWYTQQDLDGLTAVTTIAINAATDNGVHCCTSIGNDGHDSDPGTSHMLAPADAFEVLACGAVGSDGGISIFSSDGPSADGRVKPEVLARGVDTWTIASHNTTDYNAATGTSLSSPMVAGAVACLVQLHPEWTPHQMRTVLFHTADDFVANGTHDPLFVRGYGVINAYDAGLDCNMNAILDECDLDCGPAAGPCDVPGCAGSNDCNTDGIPDECEPDCNENGIADTCDIADCDAGDPLCADCNRNGMPDECEDPFPQQGRITLDKDTYVCSDTAVIRVNDCGLNNDPDAAEDVEILVQSDSEPAGEVVLLTENAANSGAFESSIQLSLLNEAGVLQVADGDVISATYTDADNGLGGFDVMVVADGILDCHPPLVSDVQTLVPNPFEAFISFATDEPATATVRYGLTCDALDLQVSETQLNTSFNIELTELNAVSTYYFVIDVQDAFGNADTDDNNGSCYSFETPEIPDYYTEHFENDDNDLDYRTLRFTPDGSPDIYAPCTYEILDFPTDPAGGTVLDIDEPEYATVTLPEGFAVELYGVSYTTFYVGGHGYITFESPDDESWDTLEHHFSQPRISALFDLLEPELGTISWKLLGDRVAVSWENVPELFQGNNNTFQVEMFFDGRIQISYLTIDDEDALAGLSAGTGVVPGFEETDLSALDGCGPQPPAATGSEVVTPQDTLLQIQLLAIDEGLPDPPGALSYIIAALPEHGDLLDPQAGVITEAPYTLMGNTGLVEYMPAAGYGGLDAFEFKANDGGMPPDGGDSNTATINITVGLAQVIYNFDMEHDPGFSAEGQWAFGQPTGGGSHDGDPMSGFTGSNVYGYNLNGDYPNDLPPTHLTTMALDCRQLVHTRLRFWRWLGVEFANYDHATVSASTDGNTWQVVWDHEGGAISDTTWVEQSFDVSTIADGEPTVYLRWTMGPTDDLVTYPGWNLDDIQIEGVVTSLTGDVNGDGTVDVLDLLELLAAWGPCPGCPADLNGDGTVGILDLLMLLGNWS